MNKEINNCIHESLYKFKNPERYNINLTLKKIFWDLSPILLWDNLNKEFDENNK